MKLFALLTFFIVLNTQAQIPLIKYFVPTPKAKTMQLIADQFEVLSKSQNGYEVYVPQNKVNAFLKLVPKAEVIFEKQMERKALAGYRDFTKLQAELKAINAKYPEITKLEQYGKTSGGLPLYALKISDNVNEDEDEPELMITAATHGDELITVEVAMNLFLNILENYNKDARLSKFINEREIYFIPVVNPEGYSKQSRYAHNIDPNRDYPMPGAADKTSVDCIDALRKFFHAHNIVGSLDIHASGKLVMFPWAYTYDAIPEVDRSVFQQLVDYMAEKNGYTAGQISKVIYVAKGSSADYYYWKNKTVAIAAELTTTKVPSAQAIPAVTEEAREMLWRFIEHF